MHLNHPETMPSHPEVHGKIIFHEASPWCQKVWGPLSYSIQFSTLFFMNLFSNFMFVSCYSESQYRQTRNFTHYCIVIYCYAKIFPQSQYVKTTKIISHSFHGSGVWEQFSWVVLVQNLSRCQPGLQSSEGSVPKKTHLLGCWLEASVPYDTYCAPGLLRLPHNMAAGFLQRE